MRKISPKNARSLKWLAAGAFVVSPLALVIACGQTSNKPPVQSGVEIEGAKYLTAEVEPLKIGTDQFNTALVFGPTPKALPASLTNFYELEYSTNAFSTEALAQTSNDPALWTKTLPTNIDPLIEARSFWARLKTLQPSVAPTLVRNLTTSSLVKQAKVAVQDLASFKAYQFSSAKLTGTTLNPSFASGLSTDLARFVKVQLQTKTWAYQDQTPFLNQLKAASDFDLTSDTVNAKFATLNSLYVLPEANNAPVALDLSGLTTVPVDSAAAQGSRYLNEQIAPLKISADQFNTALTFSPAAAALPAALTPFYELQYSTSFFNSADVAKDSNDPTLWTTSLPTRTAPLIAERYLWARLNAKQPNVAASIALDLTTSSDLSLAKVDVKALPSFQAFNLSNATVSGLAADATIKTNLTAPLANFVKVQYQTKDWAYQDEAAFLAQLKTDSTFNPRTDNILAKFVPLNNVYVLADADNVPVRLNTDGLTTATTAVQAGNNFLVNEIRKSKVGADQFYDNLSFSPAPAALPADLASVYDLEYSTTEFLSADAALNSTDSSLWSPNLPTATRTSIDMRVLWARLKSKRTGLASVVNNLTYESGIRTAKVDIKNVPAFKNYKLSSVRATGVSNDIFIENYLGPQLSDLVKIQYQTKNLDYLDEADFIAAVNADASFDPTKDVVKAKFVSLNPLYILADADNVPVNIDISSLAQPPANSIEADANTFMRQGVIPTRFNPSSFNSAASYNTTPSSVPAALAPNYTLEFSTNNFTSATQARDSTDASLWTANLPSRVDPLVTNRFFWARLKSTNLAVANNVVANLTMVSDVQKVQVDVKSLPSFANFKLSDVTLSGFVNDAKIDTKLPAELAQYTQVLFKLNNGPYLNATDFIAQLKTVSNFNPKSDVILVKLAPLNSAYVLNDSDNTPDYPNRFSLETPKSDREKRATEYLDQVIDPLRASGTANNVVWTPSAPPALPGDLATYYSPIEFSSSLPNFNSSTGISDESHFVWSTSLPTRVDATPERRYLWTRLVSKDKTLADDVHASANSTGIFSLPAN